MSRRRGTQIDPPDFRAGGQPGGFKNEAMLATRARTRCIEPMPALLVMTLNELGKLPDIPNLPQPGVFGFRRPDLADMESLTWLAQWEGPRVDRDGFRKVSGLASYRDLYDWHTASDVREITAIRGCRRAVVDLIRFICGEATALNRRPVASISRRDDDLANLIARLGCNLAAVVPWEYVPSHN